MENACIISIVNYIRIKYNITISNELSYNFLDSTSKLSLRDFKRKYSSSLSNYDKELLSNKKEKIMLENIYFISKKIINSNYYNYEDDLNAFKEKSNNRIKSNKAKEININKNEINDGKNHNNNNNYFKALLKTKAETRTNIVAFLLIIYILVAIKGIIYYLLFDIKTNKNNNVNEYN